MTGRASDTTSTENPVLHANIPPILANSLKKALLARGWLMTGTNPTRVGDKIGFPLAPVGATEIAQQTLREQFPEVEFLVLGVFPKAGLRPRTLIEALGKTIPPEMEPYLPRSWDIVGNIAVVEGPKDPVPALEPHWGAIGQAVIAVNPAVSSVFLKASAVTGEFRTRDLHCIAGPDVSETVYKENDCTFHLDLRKVFFSPRLVTERARVAHLRKLDDELVLDMFAGVGPFAIQRAKVQGVQVVAVDKNPDAVAYLRQNAGVNRVSHLIRPICADVDKMGDGDLGDIVGKASRVIMNLPERALDFVPQALKALKSEGGAIHLYQFVGGEDPLFEGEKRFKDALQAAKGRLLKVQGVKIVKPYAPYEYLIVVDALCKP